MFEKDSVDRLEKIFNGVVAVCGLILLVGGNGVIFSRIFNISLPWTEEILRNVFVLLVFFGAAFESKRGLVAVSICDDIAIKYRSSIAYKLFKMFQTLAMLLFAVGGTYYGFTNAIKQFKSGQTSLILKYPIGLITMGVSIACAIMVVYQAVLLIHYGKTSAAILLPEPEGR